EVLPGEQRRDADRVGHRAHRDVDRALVDDVELAARVALLEHRLTRFEPFLLEALGEGHEVIACQRFEEGNPSEELRAVHGRKEYRQTATRWHRGAAWRIVVTPMWLVRIALKRPYTFVVMSMLIVIVGVLAVLRMPTDIFPDIDIPVISVIWNYGGLPPEEMEKRIVSNFERFLTTVVNNIDHLESQSLTGIAVIKVFLQPGASVDEAVAQVTATAQTAVRSMPQGTVPPLIIRYSASNVPILQVALESQSLSEQQLFDYGVNFVR